MHPVDNIDVVLNSRHYQANYTPPKENILFKICGENIGSEGNFAIFSGLPKAGKSTFIAAALAAACMGQSVFGLEMIPKQDRPMIGYFDTESAQYDFYKNINRIKSLARLPDLPITFNAFNTRQDGAAVNRQLIEHYIVNYPASIVVIDGLLDIITNFNDEKESRFIIEWLKKITTESKVFVLGVIHTGKKDGFTLGHYGSMLDRYSQSVIEITKDIEFNLYRLSPKYLRSSGGFTDIAIQFTGHEYVECNLPPPKKK